LIGIEILRQGLPELKQFTGQRLVSKDAVIDKLKKAGCRSFSGKIWLYREEPLGVCKFIRFLGKAPQTPRMILRKLLSRLR
jgi:hypothetical protein